MSQAMEQAVGAKTGQMLEADAAGTLVIPAEILGYPEPKTRFVVERVAGKILIQPETVPVQESKQKLTFDEWQVQWKELQARMSQVWKTDKSAAEIISEMRR